MSLLVGKGMRGQCWEEEEVVVVVVGGGLGGWRWGRVWVWVGEVGVLRGCEMEGVVGSECLRWDGKVCEWILTLYARGDYGLIDC